MDNRFTLPTHSRSPLVPQLLGWVGYVLPEARISLEASTRDRGLTLHITKNGGPLLRLAPWSKPADALVLLSHAHGLLSFSPSGVVTVSSSFCGRSVFVRLTKKELDKAYPNLSLDPVCVGVMSLLVELDRARSDPASWFDKRAIAGLHVCATLLEGISYA